ncbi:ABC transporter permease [Clostridium coskatii]|uniref:Aliphatic sulfonates transport permease protein SsuC n=1 Tax=Clostridium coskatii TaxID=1705578 RepID=A0A166TLN4_9CLOT|nr:ABC transporter permease [Clostridium coskatii]OAA93843.1 putative aliphatic sulfonates transport permease protein SsuC [Clostridium coskatii]OBR95171.1 putative aliphatic sulfonates transport permease protein SsuC [Clostridium coskatii]
MNRTEKYSNCFQYYILKYLGVMLILLLWQLLPSEGILDSQFVPPLSKVLVQLCNLWVYNGLFIHIMVSLWRVIVGLLIAIVIAVPLGFLLGGWFTHAADILDPLFRIFSQVNPFSLMPIFILFFGIGESAKLAVVAWVCMWPVLYNTIAGARRVDPILIKTALSMKASNWQMLTKVMLPGAGPSIFLGLRVGVEMSFFMLIGAEMVGATAGVGWFFHNSAMNNQIPRMYAAGICIVILGLALNRFLIYIQNKMFFWKESPHVFSFTKWKNTITKFSRIQITAVTITMLVIIGIGSFEVQVAKITDSRSNLNMHMNTDTEKGMHMDMSKDKNMHMSK